MYRIYHKLWCDMPGCETQAGDKANVRPGETWWPGGQARAPGVPPQWVVLPLFPPVILCPKHALTVDGKTLLQVQEEIKGAKALIGLHRGSP